MKRGERRGPLPEEEYVWLRAHLRCRSIKRLFAEYSKVFSSPYSDIISFRRVLDRYDLFPITDASDCDNLNRLIRMYYQGSGMHWEFKSDSLKQGIIRTPHWLWVWHRVSIKTPSGVSFREYPLKQKEKQFAEKEVDSSDSN